MTTVSRTRASFERLVQIKGADVQWHREIGGVPCPCLTPEGFRDPEWHRAHPSEPICNDDGLLAASIQNEIIKAFVQPAFISNRSRANQLLMEQFGEIEADDHMGFFPIQSGSFIVDFSEWSDSGTDWVAYNDMRFIAVAWNVVPAPDNASINHHWEVALRRINLEGPNG